MLYSMEGVHWQVLSMVEFPQQRTLVSAFCDWAESLTEGHWMNDAMVFLCRSKQGRSLAERLHAATISTDIDARMAGYRSSVTCPHKTAGKHSISIWCIACRCTRTTERTLSREDSYCKCRRERGMLGGLGERESLRDRPLNRVRGAALYLPYTGRIRVYQ